MSSRCRNCGKVITMSNINTSIFGLSGVCGDCHKQNQGVNFLIMKNGLDNEKVKNNTNKEWNDSYGINAERRHQNTLAIEARKEREKEWQARMDAMELVKIEIAESERIYKEKLNQKDTRELWVYLLKQGTISAFDDIELDETGATYTIIPMGKADRCPAALKYREENKIDVN